MTEPAEEKGDLSVTALYTSYAWVWGKLPNARLFALPEAKVVFRVTNIALWCVRLFKWSLRSLRHSLVHRHTLIDALLSRSGMSQVLELAAGLSRRGATVSADPAIRYIEVDLPPMIARKQGLLAESPEGQAVAARANLRLVAGDVTELELATLLDPDRPAFVIAEGLLMYLEPEAQQALWRRIATLLAPRGGTFVFDLVPTCEEPKPGVLGRGLEWLMKRFTGGRSFERDARTRDDLADQVRAAGFDAVTLLEPTQVAHEYALPFPDKVTQQLLFVCQREAST